MKHQKIAIRLFVMFTILLIGCNHKSGDHNLGNIHGVKKEGTVKIESSNTNMVDQNTIPPFKELDSLIRLLNKNFAFSETCLKVRLIEGLAAKYCVYERSERPGKLLEERDRLISIAKIKI